MKAHLNERAALLKVAVVIHEEHLFCSLDGELASRTSEYHLALSVGNRRAHGVVVLVCRKKLHKDCDLSDRQTSLSIPNDHRDLIWEVHALCRTFISITDETRRLHLLT